MRGSFVRHPERSREDLPGAGPFDATPPAHLTFGEITAWHQVLIAVPLIALASSDRIGIEQMARILAALNAMPAVTRDFIRLDSALRQWAIQMGMTPSARRRMGIRS